VKGRGFSWGLRWRVTGLPSESDDDELRSLKILVYTMYPKIRATAELNPRAMSLPLERGGIPGSLILLPYY